MARASWASSRERDYAQKVEVRGRTSTGTPISEVMTPDVIFVTPATTSQESAWP